MLNLCSVSGIAHSQKERIGPRADCTSKACTKLIHAAAAAAARMTQASQLDAAYNMCRWLGIFRPAGQSWPAAAAYVAYQAAFFTVVFAVSASMTVRLFASADDLTMLARTIDLWTMCWTALYKWTAMVACDGPFRQFHARLAAAGDGARADLYAAARLRHAGPVSYAYVLSGFLVAVSMSLSPLISYPRGYVRSHVGFFRTYDRIIIALIIYTSILYNQ